MNFGVVNIAYRAGGGDLRNRSSRNRWPDARQLLKSAQPLPAQPTAEQHDGEDVEGGQGGARKAA